MQTPSQEEVRRAVAAARTVVVKVGSSSLTQPSGHLDVDKLNALVGAIAQVRMLGGNIVLVSSGAIAAGFGPLGFESRPTDVATQQATASVGQGLLMAQYEMAFGRYGIRVGQLLITAEDTMQPRQYRNARRTMAKLLELGVVPIVNENDALASNEIRFGDNDRLSAIVTALVGADLLILLSDIDGLFTDDPHTNPEAEFIDEVHELNEDLLKMGKDTSSSNVGTGGMASKLTAARLAVSSGADMIIANGKDFRILHRLMNGEHLGTLFAGASGKDFYLMDYLEKL